MIKAGIIIVILSFICIVKANKCNTDSKYDENCDTVYLGCSDSVNKCFEKIATNPNTKFLNVQHCEYLTDISALKNSYLKSIYLFNLPSLENITALKYLSTIKSITIDGISKKANFNALNGLPALDSLWLANLPNLKSLNFLKNQKELRSLKIGLRESQINDYYIIDTLSNLQELVIAYSKINDYHIFKDLHNLKKIKIKEIDTLNLTGIEFLKGLEEIDLEAFCLKNSCSTIPLLSKLKKIRIVNCLTAGFPNLDFINKFKHIEKLILESIADLDTIKLSGINISDIYMSNMNNVKFLSLSNLPKLEHIMISYFDSLSTFELNNVPNLKKLTIFNMENLENLPDLTNTPNLNILTVGNSGKIRISDKNVQMLFENDTFECNCIIAPELVTKLKNKHCILKSWDDTEIEYRNSLK